MRRIFEYIIHYNLKAEVGITLSYSSKVLAIFIGETVEY